MGGAGGGEAPGLGFDHRLEGIAVQGPLLLEVEADLRDLFRGQGLVEDAGRKGSGSFSKLCRPRSPA